MNKPKRFKDFKNYQVTLHDAQKRPKIVRIKKCRSPQAAMRLAKILEDMNAHHCTNFRSTNAYELTPDGRVIWT